MNLPFSRFRPRISIDLDQSRSYTTRDRIDGAASVTVDHDVCFDDVDITFEGMSRTTVERASVPGQSGAYQTFLKLRQPVDGEVYPSPRILHPGQTYTFPFTFVIPDRLLPQACSHKKNNRHLETAHTHLPPSMNDPARPVVDGKKSTTSLDDMSPDMCRISYFVRASLLKHSGPHERNGDGTRKRKKKVLSSTNKEVRVMPVFEEEPPIDLPACDGGDGYCTRREKDVRRGFMRSRRGRLVVEAAQPRTIEVSPEMEQQGQAKDSESVRSVATMNLRFDPANEDEQPPALGNVWTKLCASTYFSAHPWTDFPATITSLAQSWAQFGRGVYGESVPLSTRCVASASWTRHEVGGEPRRDSTNSTSSSSTACSSAPLPSPSATFTDSLPYYTASLVLPITIRKNRTLLPTFHSCLISRTYTLDLTLSYNPTNTSVFSPSVALKVPIQVSSSAADNIHKEIGIGDVVFETEGQIGGEEISEEVEAQFFTPRRVGSVSAGPGAGDAARRRVAPPPAYADYRPRLSSCFEGERPVCPAY